MTKCHTCGKDDACFISASAVKIGLVQFCTQECFETFNKSRKPIQETNSLNAIKIEKIRTVIGHYLMQPDGGELSEEEALNIIDEILESDNEADIELAMTAEYIEMEENEEDAAKEDQSKAARLDVC
jgi:hypothetical protein